jgi:MFS family permease
MSADTASAGEQSPAPEIWSAGRRNYVMAVLCLVGLFNVVDRQIITILIEPIKKEFGASDTAMGALTGVVFAGFYLAASLPLARVADLGVRRTLIAVCLAAWSGMTALGGVAQTFTQLALTRIGVAVGEAGATPASHSMISDLYPLKNRATMLGLFNAIQAIGIGCGVFLGGWLSQNFSWRAAFFIVGVPGVLMAILIMLTVKEPPRGMSEAVPVTAEKPPFWTAIRRLWSIRSLRFAALTLLLGSIPGYGMLGWGPTLFIRVHELNPAVVGFWFGTLVAAGLFVGGLLSGILGDRLSKGDLRVYMWVSATGALISAPFGVLAVLAASPVLGFIGLFLFQLSISLHNPPCIAMAQTLAPVRMRALASVIMTMLITGVGVGVAPLLIGTLSDLFTPTFGTQGIRYAVALMMIGGVLSSLCALTATIWIRKDFERTQAEAAGLGV